MRPWLALLGFTCSTLAHAQAVAPAPVAPTAPPGFPAPSYLPPGAGGPVVGQPGQQAPPPVRRAEGVRVLRWKEGVCEGFLTLPLIEELRATIRAHLERQFRRPEVRR